MRNLAGFSAVAFLLVTGCATTPTSSPVDVQVSAQHATDSRFAALVQKQTLETLHRTAPSVPALKLTATIEEIASGPGGSFFVSSGSTGHPVASLSPDHWNDGVTPMVGVTGGGASDTMQVARPSTSAALRGTYAITDASGKTLEAGPLHTDDVVNNINTPLGARMSLSRITSDFLAGRVAAVARRTN